MYWRAGCGYHVRNASDRGVALARCSRKKALNRVAMPQLKALIMSLFNVSCGSEFQKSPSIW
jgi:hypothetical protein